MGRGHEVAEQRCVDAAGTDGVDAYSEAPELDRKGAGQHDHSAFRRAVRRGEGLAFDSGDRTDVADCTAGFQQVRHGLAAHQEGPGDVDVEVAVPGVHVGVLEALESADPGDVGDNVELAVLVDDVLDGGGDSGLVGDVELDGREDAASGCDLFAGLLGGVPVDVDSDDGSAVCCISRRGCLADTRPCACHGDDLVCESTHCCSSFRRCRPTAQPKASGGRPLANRDAVSPMESATFGEIETRSCFGGNPVQEGHPPRIIRQQKKQ